MPPSWFKTNSSDNPTQRQALLILWPHLDLSHHLPGRVRLRIKPGVAALRALREVEKIGSGGELGSYLKQLPGIRSVQLSLLAGSVLLEYDPEIIPFKLVDDFFRSPSVDRAGELVDRLLSGNQSNNKEKRNG